MNAERYIEIQIRIADETYKDMVLAELTLLGFDQLEEHDWGFSTYSHPNDFVQDQIQEMVDHYSAFTTISWTHEQKESKNWNEEWEKGYQPIVVGSCRVRASFHPSDPNYELELVINPKMSFGTGHHETTRLMMEFLLSDPIKGLSVGDMGTGSGILAILSAKLGAKEVFGCDVDDWVIDNATENAQINQLSDFTFLLGTLAEVRHKMPVFDLILANINRNVLLGEMTLYKEQLKPGGVLLLSGFLQEDIKCIEESLEANGMVLNDMRTGPHSWTAIKAINY